MSPRSLHAVGPVHSGTRDALIFNFYHVGNTLRIERDVRKALGEAKLPAGIARVLGLASMIIERKLTGRAAKDARDALSHATDMAGFAQSCGCVEQQLAGLLRRRLGFLREIFPAAESLLAAVAAAGTLPAPDMARRQPGETASTGDVAKPSSLRRISAILRSRCWPIGRLVCRGGISIRARGGGHARRCWSPSKALSRRSRLGSTNCTSDWAPSRPSRYSARRMAR